jgi:hypothetical protein
VGENASQLPARGRVDRAAVFYGEEGQREQGSYSGHLQTIRHLVADARRLHVGTHQRDHHERAWVSISPDRKSTSLSNQFCGKLQSADVLDFCTEGTLYPKLISPEFQATDHKGKVCAQALTPIAFAVAARMRGL